MAESVQRRGDDPIGFPGMEIFEITPVILGGSATDPSNKILLDRAAHLKAVAYWNGVIAELRGEEKRM